MKGQIFPGFTAEVSLYVSNIAANGKYTYSKSNVVLMLQRQLGTTGGACCESESGNQKCCCAVGEKCVSGILYCECKDAHGYRFGASNEIGMIL